MKAGPRSDGRSRTLIAASSCSASRSIPKKRASSRTPGGHSGQRCQSGFTEPRRAKKSSSPTSQVHAFVDDQLTVSQVVEDGLKVLWAAVDQVRSALVPLVPPHVWNDGSQSNHKTPQEKWERSARELTHLPEHVGQHAVRLFADQRAPEHSNTSSRSAYGKAKP